MITINWAEFEAKFGAGTQVEFERLAYLIFCHLYGKKYGIFRFRNHPGCETEPVQHGGETIGFQAKYYRNGLSGHWNDFKEAIEVVRAHDSKINKLFFFLPTDLTYNTQGKDETLKTSIQERIEQYAKDKGISIEWFGEGRIETALATNNLTLWTRHFFSRQNNAITALEELENGTKDILDGINDSITVANEKIEFDQQATIDATLQALEDKIVIISGVGGVGKSAIVKKLEKSRAFDLFLVVRPHEIKDKLSRAGFNRNWQTTVDGFLEICSDCPRRILVLDAAEKISVLEDRDVIFSTLKRFRLAGWKILLTSRKVYESQLQFSVWLKVDEVAESIHLDTIPKEKIESILAKRGDDVVVSESTKEFLTIPFYLNIYLTKRPRFKSCGHMEFVNEVWSDVVMNGDPADTAGRALMAMIAKKVATDAHYLDVSNCQPNDISTLERRELIVHREGSNKAQLVHDIFEEMCICKIVAHKCLELEQANFERDIISSYAYRRGFKQWIAYAMFDDNKNLTDRIVASVLNTKHKVYRNEYILAMAEDSVCDKFLTRYRALLLAEGKDLFFEFVNTVYSLKRNFLPQRDPKVISLSIPEGKVWQSLIHFIDENINAGILKCEALLPLMSDWCSSYPDSEAAKICTQIALEIYHKRLAADYHSEFYVGSDELANLLIAAGIGNFEKIKHDIDADIDNEHGDISSVASRFVHKLLINWHDTYAIAFIDRNHSYVLDLARRRWQHRYHRHSWYASSAEFEKAPAVFGIDQNTEFEYGEPSAFQTPIYRILKAQPHEALCFIVEFVNYSIDKAVAKYPSYFAQTTFSFPDGTKIEQYISDELWSSYRTGYSFAIPKLFSCIHMALEKFLLELAQDTKILKSAWFKSVLKMLIVRSKSASISAVVASIVLAHYESLFDIALILFTSREAFACDYRRQHTEEQLKLASGMFKWHTTIHSYDRELADKKDFRKYSLEGMAEWYQLSVVPGEEHPDEKIHAIFDNMFPDKASISIEDKFFLRRVDTRFQIFKATNDPQTGRPAITVEPKLTDELIRKQKESQQQIEPLLRTAPMGKWGYDVLHGSEVTKLSFCDDVKAKQMASELCKNAGQLDEADSNFFFARKNAIDCAVALLVKYDATLPRKIRKVCGRIVDEGWARICSPKYNFQIGDGVMECILAQPYVMKFDWLWTRRCKLRQFIKLFFNKQTVDIHGYRRMCDIALQAVRDYGADNPSYIRAILSTYKRSCSNLSADFYINAIMLMPTNLALDRLFLEMLKTGAAIALKEIYKKDEKGHDNVFRYSATAVEFCRHLARCLITMQEYDVDEILASIVNVPEVFSDGNFLECLIFAADADPSATNRFWHIWEKLMSTISSMVHNAPKGVLVDKDGLIRAYLLAMPYWASDVKQWKHLSVGNMEFLDKVVDELKDVPGTAEALIRFANTVGQGFKQEIIPWLALVFEFAHFDAYDDDERIERIKKDMSPLLIEIAKNGDFVKADECWRKAFLNLLDHLVLHRSIEAFYVRDQILS